MATFRGSLSSELEDGDWPGLQVVEVSKSKRVYAAAKSADLLELLNRQVIKSRDPRLSPELPENSVYNGLADTPQEPDSPDGLHSADFREQTTKGDTQSIKVHVNPKFFPKLLPTSVSQEDIKADEMLSENIGEGHGDMSNPSLRDEEQRARLLHEQDKNLFKITRTVNLDDEMILLQQGFDTTRSVTEEEQIDKQKNEAQGIVKSVDEEMVLEERHCEMDIDPDEEILLQQFIGRKEKKEADLERRPYRKKRKTKEDIYEAASMPKPVTRPEPIHQSPRIVALQQERPFSRNSERSLDSLEQEKARIEEMILREQLDRTPRSMDMGTPQRPTAVDEMLAAQAVDTKAFERSHMARPSVKNITMDTTANEPERDQLDLHSGFKSVAAVDRQKTLTSYEEEMLHLRARREMELSAFDRRARLDRLKAFSRNDVEPAPKLTLLSSVTRGVFEKTSLSDMKYTDKSYRRSKRDVLDDIGMVSLGVRSKYEEYYGHLKELSVQTELEASLIPDLPRIKRIYVDSLRDWMRLKPLDALVTGRLRAAGLTSTMLKTCRSADDTAEAGQRMLAKNIFYLMKGKQYRTEPDNLYKRPTAHVEEVGNDAFRQVRHYMDFVASKSQSDGKLNEEMPQLSSRDQQYSAIPEKMHSSNQSVYGMQAARKTKLVTGYDDAAEEKLNRNASPQSPAGDLYSPTRPTDQDDAELPLAVDSRKRKVSSGEGTDAKKVKSSKKKKRSSRSRSKSREKSKDKEGKKKKDKKHKKEKDREKSKHRKKSREGSETKDKPAREKGESDKSKSRSQEKKVSDSEAKHSRERKISDGEKPKEVPVVPKVVPKVAPIEVITKKQREQAKEALKKCASMFFDNMTLLKFSNAYGFVPQKRSGTLGDVPYPKPTTDNTFSAAWCILQFFKDRENMKFTDSTKELLQFVVTDLEPENGFMWACLLAIQESLIKEVHEYAEKHKDLLNTSASEEAIGKTVEKTDGDTLTKSKKGGNSLMLAFRQALQEKKRAEMGLSSKSSTLAKLTPEQAAKKPAPKPSRPLFKPPIAYQLEKTNPDHETGVQQEFYSINDIIKLSEPKLMDDLVRKQLLTFLRQTVEAQENTCPTLAQAFQESVQPIVLKNIPSVRNLLSIASTFVSIFKEKQAENQPDIVTKAVQKPEVGTPVQSEATTNLNEYGSVAQNVDSAKQVQPAQTESANSEYATSVAHSVDSTKQVEPVQTVSTSNEYGTSFGQHIDSTKPVLNEYGGVANDNGTVNSKVELMMSEAVTTSVTPVTDYGTVTKAAVPSNEYGSSISEYGSVQQSAILKAADDPQQLANFSPHIFPITEVKEKKEYAIKFSGFGSTTTKIPGIMDYDEDAIHASEPVQTQVPKSPERTQAPVPNPLDLMQIPIPKLPEPIQAQVPMPPEPVQAPVPKPIQAPVQKPAERIQAPIPKLPEPIQIPVPKPRDHIQAPVPKLPEPIQIPIPKPRDHIQAPVPKLPEPIQIPVPKPRDHIQAPVPKLPEPIQIPVPKPRDHIQAPIPKLPEPVQVPAPENPLIETLNEAENTDGSTDASDVPLKRQFRKRQGSNKKKYESEILEKAPRLSKKENRHKKESRKKTGTDSLELSEIDDGSESALQKFRKMKEKKSSLDVRIAAILGDESPRVASPVTTTPDNTERGDHNIVIMNSEEDSAKPVAAPPVPEIPNGVPVNTNVEQQKHSQIVSPSETPTPPEDIKKSAFNISKKPSLMRSNKLLQAFKQQKSMGSHRYACTSTQRVTASDILARLQAKDRPSTPTQHRPATPTQDEEVRQPQPMEIEDVSSPRVDENEDLYQQVFSKDSEALDIPMDSSPIETSLQLAPCSDDSLNTMAPGLGDKPRKRASGLEDTRKTVIGKAAVMYKPPEPSQGIQSLATAVPPSASMQDMNDEVQLSELSQVEDLHVPRSAAALLPPPPVEIPLPPRPQTPPPLPSQPESYAPQYSSDAQTYTPHVSNPADPYSHFAEYAAQYAAQNQYNAQYPAASTTDTTVPTQYDTANTQYDAANTQYDAATTQYDAANTQYDAANTQYDAANTQQYNYDYSQYPGYDYNQQSWGEGGYQQAWDQYYQQQGEAAPGYSDWQQWTDWNQQTQQAQWGQLPPPPQPPGGTLPDLSLPPPGFDPPMPPQNYGGVQQHNQGGGPPHHQPPMHENAPPMGSDNERPRRGGKSSTPPPSSAMRYYVFNKEKRITRNLEGFMRYMHAKPFDPYNIQSTLQQPAQDFVVYMHRSDTHNIHMVPNLLQLKQEPNIQFAMYNRLEDFKSLNLDPVLVKGGQVIADDTVLFETVPETIGDILQYMLQQSEEGIPWSFKIHRKILNLIRAKKDTEDDEDQECCRRLDDLIGYYGERGVIDVLELHDCDTGVQPSHTYLQCCLRLQSRYVRRFRHSLLLTKMPSNEAAAWTFLDQGIGVLSVPDFVQNIIGQDCPDQLPDFPQRPTPKTKAYFCDAILSTGIDRLDLPFYDPEEVLKGMEEFIYQPPMETERMQPGEADFRNRPQDPHYRDQMAMGPRDDGYIPSLLNPEELERRERRLARNFMELEGNFDRPQHGGRRGRGGWGSRGGRGGREPEPFSDWEPRSRDSGRLTDWERRIMNTRDMGAGVDMPTPLDVDSGHDQPRRRTGAPPNRGRFGQKAPPVEQPVTAVKPLMSISLDVDEPSPHLNPRQSERERRRQRRSSENTPAIYSEMQADARSKTRSRGSRWSDTPLDVQETDETDHSRWSETPPDAQEPDETNHSKWSDAPEGDATKESQWSVPQGSDEAKKSKWRDAPQESEETKPSRWSDAPPESGETKPSRWRDAPPESGETKPSKWSDAPPESGETKPSKWRDAPPQSEETKPSRWRDAPPESEETKSSRWRDAPPESGETKPSRWSDAPPVAVDTPKDGGQTEEAFIPTEVPVIAQSDAPDTSKEGAPSEESTR